MNKFATVVHLSVFALVFFTISLIGWIIDPLVVGQISSFYLRYCVLSISVFFFVLIIFNLLGIAISSRWNIRVRNHFSMTLIIIALIVVSVTAFLSLICGSPSVIGEIVLEAGLLIGIGLFSLSSFLRGLMKEERDEDMYLMNDEQIH